jgi:DNA segregation ATPase FtsK/SpoIIIE, S-DNA-T family
MTERHRRLVVVSGPLAGSVMPLPEGEHVLGRGAPADLRLDEPAVARRHLRLRVMNGTVTMSPGEPRAVTYVAGRPVTAGQRLVPGQIFEVGHSLLVVRDEAEPSCHRDFRRPASPPPPGPDLELRLPPAPSDPPAIGLGRWRRAGEAANFRRALAEAGVRLEALRAREALAMHARAPDPAELELRARLARPGLWERRPAEPCFLRLRVGWCDLPSRVRVVVPEGGRPELRAEALAMAAATRVPAVPLTVDLPALGTLAIAGPPAIAAGLARWLVIQAAVLHSPSELAIAAFLPPHAEDDWGWLRALPHAAGTLPGTRVPLVGSSGRDQRWLAAALAERDPCAPGAPAMLVVVHEAAPFPPRTAAGLVVRICEETATALDEPGAAIELDPSGLELRLPGTEVTGVPDLVDLDHADTIVRALAAVGVTAPRHVDSTVIR